MEDWTQEYDSLNQQKVDDLTSFNQADTSMAPDPVADSKAKQKRLDEYLEEQEKLDKDEFTDEEKAEAEAQFGLDEILLDNDQKPANKGDLGDLFTGILSTLESQHRLVPHTSGAVEDEVVVLDADLKPVWGAGGLPPAPAEAGKLLISNGEDPPGWDAGYLTWR